MDFAALSILPDAALWRLTYLSLDFPPVLCPKSWQMSNSALLIVEPIAAPVDKPSWASTIRYLNHIPAMQC